MNNVLQQLTATLEQRKNADPEQSYVASLHQKGLNKILADPEQSYVASLHQKGLNKILEKVGEEATEVILAAKDAQRSGDQSELIAETADLWFHCMVMLSHLGGSAEDVMAILRDRFDLSGLEEKAEKLQAQVEIIPN